MIRKSMPSGYDPMGGTGFPKRSCVNKELGRDDDSSRSNRPFPAVFGVLTGWTASGG